MSDITKEELTPAEKQLSRKNSFKKEWINKAIVDLGLNRRSVVPLNDIEDRLDSIFEEDYRERTIKIENTFNFNQYNISAENMWFNIKKKCILTENAVLTYKHEHKLALVVDIMATDIEVRQVIKKSKIEYERAGNSELAIVRGKDEANAKAIINAYYGQFLFPNSSFSLTDLGSLITTVGRNAISITSITFELISGGFRNYRLQAYTKIINETEKELEFLKSLYPDLPPRTTDEALRSMLGYYYDTYYAKSILRDIIENLTDYHKSVLCIKNNFINFFTLPKIDKIIREACEIIADKNYLVNPYKPYLTGDTEVIAQTFIKNGVLEGVSCRFEGIPTLEELIGKDKLSLFNKYIKAADSKAITELVNSIEITPELQVLIDIAYYRIAKQNRLIEIMKELYTDSHNLLHGFYYFDGDYIDGVFYPTTVDILGNMKRKCIVGGDTDSAITTVFEEVCLILEKYGDLFDKMGGADHVTRYGSLPLLAGWIYRGTADKTLDIYNKAKGISEEYRKDIALEIEYVKEQSNVSLGKKAYCFIPCIKDFWIVGKRKLVNKGLSYIKGNFNPQMCEIAESTVTGMLTVEIDKLDYKDTFTKVKANTERIKNTIRCDEYILKHRTILKASRSDIKSLDHRMKSLNLWNRLIEYDENLVITTPGGFGVIKLELGVEYLERLQVALPNVHKHIAEHVSIIHKLKVASVIVAKSKKLAVDNELVCSALAKCKKVDPEIIRRELEKLVNKYKFKDINAVTEADYYTMMNDMANYTEDVIKELQKIFTKFNKEVDNKYISKEVTKLAVPLNLQIVPDFLKFENYGMISVLEAKEYEHLIAPLVTAISLDCIIDSDGKQQMTNKLLTF